ncbi:UDP-forming cellulose synthase catalytic subunit [Halomonas sp. DP1Y21-3]|uniref:UDP-forming cellulose synthase catalytic subunit n=1 Tax=Halomonas sp. DP1Y21-3 TaxID=2859080 RepID=UPI001C980A36|nr:UDP-forming cellulose synthase catalytic subunit [Halomonas sp. DP1Y21-3]MBY6110935.1 UDP-forming cellulose synthase catalytic subunit [Halomonas sp. DP1Y21-3]
MNVSSSASLGARLLALILGAPLAALLVTTPLTLERQLVFAGVGMLALLVLARLRGGWVRQAMMLLSVLVSTRYLYWRLSETLVFDTQVEAVFGYGLLAAECYAWVILVLGYFQIAWPLERAIRPMPPDATRWPTVDIYIPTYNESLEVVRDTVLAAQNIDYPADRMRIYVLDDGKRPEFGAFAAAVGVGYITREDNSHAKAGNLNHAMGLTDGELICVFDCDHVATRAFLQATVGEFVADERLALLQTPHHFYSPDPFERNLVAGADIPNEGELFYGPVQKGNDYWNAAFFCGSCALMRRSALEEIGGFAVETVTEDAHTALKLQRRGWNTAFLGVRLAAGLATERLSLHIGQRARWARGMTQIFRLDNPLWGRGLRLPQRLCYLNAMLHFQFAMPRLVFLTAPLAYLLFDLHVIASSPQMIAVYALPHLFHAIYTNSRLVGRFRYSFWGEIYESVLAFHLLKPTLVTLLSPRRGKFNVTEKGGLLEEGYFDGEAVRPHLFVLGLLVAAVVWGLVRVFWNDLFDVQTSVMLFNVMWASVSILVLLAAIAVARETRQLRRSVRVEARLPVVLHLASGHAVQSWTANLSMGGALVEGKRSALGSEVECLEITFNRRGLMFPVCSVNASGTDDSLRFRFDELPLRQRRELVRVVMGRADAWIPEAPHPQDRPLASLWHVVRSVVGLFFHQWQQKGLHFRSPVRGLTQGRFSRGWLAPVMLVATIVLGVLMVSHRVWAQVPAPTIGVTHEAGGFGDVPGDTSVPGETLPPLRFGEDGRLDLDSVSQPLQPTRRELSIPLLAADETLRLTPNTRLSGTAFSLRDDEVAVAASLSLSLSHSDLPADSQLGVLLNGETLQTIDLDQFNAGGMTQRLDIPSALILPFNRLEFRLLGQATQQCHGDDQAVGRVEIAPESRLALTLQRLPTPDELARLPRPFIDVATADVSRVAMVMARDASEAQLRGAAIIASHFGRYAEAGQLQVEALYDRLPLDNAVVIGRSGQRLAGLTLPQVEGPTLLMRPNPRNPLFKLLLVVGNSDVEVARAARGLALSGLGESLDSAAPVTLSGERLRLDDERLSPPAPREPYDAPRWVDVETPARLASLGEPEGFVARGLSAREHALSLRVPPDLFLWPGQNYRLRVDYRFPDEPWLDPIASSLDVSLNGEYLAALPVESGKALERLWQRLVGAGREQSAEVLLPRDLLYGNNRLQFYFHLAVADGVDCAPGLGEDAISRILPTTTLDLRRAEHFSVMPSLSSFVSAGFPFSRQADLGASVALVPEAPDESELSALLTSVGRIAGATGYPALGIEVRRGLSLTGDLVDKDLLVVADLDSLAQTSLFDAGVYRADEGRLAVAEVPWMKRWRYWLLGDWRPLWREVAQALQDSEVSQGLVSLPSPLNRSRFVVAAVADDAEALPSLVARLGDDEISRSVYGDLALIPVEGSAESFRAGPRQGVGEMPWHMRLRWMLGQNLVAMAVLLLVVVTLLGLVCHRGLARRAARRLQGGQAEGSSGQADAPEAQADAPGSRVDTPVADGKGQSDNTRGAPRR